MGTKKIILYVLIGFVVSGVFFGGLFYFMNSKEQPTETKVVYKTFEYDIGEFSTNLGSTKNYFKGHIKLETTDENLYIKLEEKNAEIRDAIITILIGKKSEEILDPEGQLKLKNEILEVVSRIIGTDKITKIFFVDYIAQ